MWFSLQLARKVKARFPAQINQQSKSAIYTSSIAFFVTIAVVTLYVLSEKTFYWWDYNTYSDIVNQKFTDFLRSPLWALQQVWWSTNKDYSDYPALLLLPFRAILGDSRLGFILSVTIAYLFPLALTLTAIATQLIPHRPTLIYGISLLIALLTPVFWAPTLRGYVDAGGALIVAVAVWIYLRDRHLTQRWQVIAIGMLLGLLPLFRRHFLYAGIAFFAAMLLQAATEPWQQWKPDHRLARRYLILRLKQIGWTALISLVTLSLLGTPFIVRLFTVDFADLYSAYKVSLSHGLQYYGIAYGWIACLLAALGFAVAYKTRVMDRAIASFILSFYGFSFLLWIVHVRIVGVHYTSHFTPLIVLGLVTLIVSLERSRLREQRRLVYRILLGSYLGINALLGVIQPEILANTPIRPTQFGISIAPIQQGTQLSELFSANYAPVRRSDYDELVRLTKTLKTLAPNQEPIYVGGASAVFNASLLQDVDRTLDGQTTLNVLPIPDTDTRDQYPIERLLQADYLVVATPFQHTINPEDQKVVRVISDMVQQGWQFTKDFRKLPAQFRLEKNVSVSLYRRLRETDLPTTLTTLQTLKTAIGKHPGGQLDWIALDHNPSFFVWRGRDIDHIYPKLEQNSGYGSFLYLNPPFPGQTHFSVTIDYRSSPQEALRDRTCPGVEFRLNAINVHAQTLYRTKQIYLPTDSPVLRLTVPTDGAAFLMLEVASLDQLHTQQDLVKFRNATHCHLRLSHLHVSSEP